MSCFTTETNNILTYPILSLGAASSTTTKTIKKLKVIVNPNAGVTKKGQSKLDVCKTVWEAKGITVEVLNTTHAGHCKEFARDEDLSDCDALCAIGGDGTLQELVNGYLSGLSIREEALKIPEWYDEAKFTGEKPETMSEDQQKEWDGYNADKEVLEKRHRVSLGFCPGGSGNSVLCDLGTWDLKTAAEIIAEGRVCKMDVNMVKTAGESIASINTICFGLIGDIGGEPEPVKQLN